MTHIGFHFNMPDKLAYACRLLRKAYAAGGPVGVVGPAPAIEALDTELWRFSALDFIPHCLASAPEAMRVFTPIVLAQDCADLPQTGVLVHLGDQVPAGFERFERLIELVDTSEAAAASDATVMAKVFMQWVLESGPTPAAGCRKESIGPC